MTESNLSQSCSQLRSRHRQFYIFFGVDGLRHSCVNNNKVFFSQKGIFVRFLSIYFDLAECSY